MVLAYDRSMRSVDLDGHLHVEKTNISKANVCPYLGREIPDFQRLGLDANKIYHLYRDPAELAKAAPTFRNKPLLDKHLPVHAQQPQQSHIVGVVGNDVAFDGTFLTADLTIWTQDGRNLVDSGAQEQLSCGYRYTADMTPGVSPDGLRYDGVMRNIIGNHVALVREGRAGPDVVVADELPKMRFKNFLTFVAPFFASAPTTEQLVAMDNALATDLALDAFDLDDTERSAACDSYAKELGKAMDALSAEEIQEAYKRAAKDKALAVKPKVGLLKVAGADIALDSADLQATIDAAIAAARTEGETAGRTAAAVDAVKIAADAKLAADALVAAKAEVAPVCGDVSCDTAEAVFRFALDHLKVELKDVPPAAYATLFRVAAKAAAAAPAPAPAVEVPHITSVFARK